MTQFLLSVARWRGAAALQSLLLAIGLSALSVGADPPAAVPLAEVNGEVITAEDLEQTLGARLRQLEEQVYDLKRKQLDTLIAERLLAQEAARRGTSVAALLDAEVTAKVGLVTEQEVEAFYQANKDRLREDEAAVRPKIRTYLQQQKLAAQRARFVESLRSQASIVDRLQAPPIVRVEVPVDGAPVRGPAQAPVTIVEFSDFHCPFCKRVQPTLAQLLERYPGKVKLVYRDFPIDGLHPEARRAAEAARCARDQGKFWEYHDLIYAGPPSATPEQLERYAKQVGLDQAAFGACLSGGTHRAAVQRDVDEGARLGVTGTPGFFINGRPLSGAQPLETFVRMIEEEFAHMSGPRAASETPAVGPVVSASCGGSTADNATPAQCAKCGNVEAVSACLEPYFRAMALQGQGKQALRDLQQLSASHALDDCHMLAHHYGHIAYKVLGNFEAAFRDGSVVCNGGYYHGVVEAAVYALATGTNELPAHHGDGHAAALAPEAPLPPNVLDVCEPFKKGSVRLYYECVHGIGHGLMYYFQHDVTLALPGCAHFTRPNLAEYCRDGIFMENILRYLPLNEADFVERARRACDGLTLTGDDFNACYVNVGEIATVYLKHDEANATGFCEVLERGREAKIACVSGVTAEMRRPH